MCLFYNPAPHVQLFYELIRLICNWVFCKHVCKYFNHQNTRKVTHLFLWGVLFTHPTVCFTFLFVDFMRFYWTEEKKAEMWAAVTRTATRWRHSPTDGWNCSKTPPDFSLSAWWWSSRCVLSYLKVLPPVQWLSVLSEVLRMQFLRLFLSSVSNTTETCSIKHRNTYWNTWC